MRQRHQKRAIVALSEYVRDELYRPGGARVPRKQDGTLDHRSWRARRLLLYLTHLDPLVTEIKAPAANTTLQDLLSKSDLEGNP